MNIGPTPSRGLLLIFTFLLSACLSACSGNPGDVEGELDDQDGDGVAPSVVSDLRIIVFSSTSVTLAWTAVGDDTTTGTATSYDLRYSKDPIGWTDWEDATQVPDEPVPAPSGTAEQMEIQGLVDGSTYYFGMKVFDEEGNWQGISNVVGVTCYDDFVVTFVDPALETAVRAGIGIPTGDIQRSDLLRLTGLQATDKGIADLGGIEYCPNLRYLILSGNDIEDLTVLAGLDNLEDLNLAGNAISDIAALAGLTSLVTLRLDDNLISTIPPLTGLTSLERLYVERNALADIGGLAGLATLKDLRVRQNNIADIAPVAGLTNLEMLFLSFNGVSNVAALAGLTKLSYLELNNANLTNISSLTGLTSLVYLFLANNHVNDLSALAGLSSLEILGLSGNQISNVGPLSGLSGLKACWLDVNQISDVGPLSGLTGIELLSLIVNLISDIGPLVANTGLGTGDTLNLASNPLSQKSINEHIPALQARGVTVTR
jgi:Leucine-rich repeat (LRR) protein